MHAHVPHVPNAVADWLLCKDQMNIHSSYATHLLRACDPSPLLLAFTMVTHALVATPNNPHNFHVCRVASSVIVLLSQCWGCAQKFHPLYLGQLICQPGSWLYPHYQQKHLKKGTRYIIQNWAVLHKVCTGEHFPEDFSADQSRAEWATQWLRWENLCLWVANRINAHKIPQFYEWETLIKETAHQTSYLGGKFLYGVLKTRYFWSELPHMYNTLSKAVLS